MPQQVQKRKGYQEEFQVEKLKKSIKNAAISASFDEDRAFQIAEEIISYVLESVRDLDNIDTYSLRDLILNKLDKDYPEIAEAWRKYDKEVKGREN